MDLTTLLNLDAAVVPVTGAASGIGLAICRRLREVGAVPLLLDVDAERLDQARRELYPGADPLQRAYCVDMRDSAAVDACLAAIRLDHGPITHAVANAGITQSAHVLEITDAQWLGLMDVNLHGTFYFCRAAARQLAERRGGSIVTMASIAGFQSKHSRIAYTTSKAAVVNMTRALAIDLGEFGVRVNAVAPGIVETPMQQISSQTLLQSMRERAPLRRLGQAQEIANAVLFLLSDLASYVTGETLVVDGGLTARYQ
jgi:NAD(P)-dependent dehydrogenase (short-subunit alcohol dehydrogenase family)